MNALPDTAMFLPMTPALRARIETAIDRLIVLLDRIDGDPDFEPGADDEPSLGWTYSYDGNSTIPSFVSDLHEGDRELEDENDEDGGDAEWSGDEEDQAWPEN